MSNEDTMGSAFSANTFHSQPLVTNTGVNVNTTNTGVNINAILPPMTNGSVAPNVFSDVQVAEITRLIRQQLMINTKTCVFTCKEYKVLQVNDIRGKSKAFLYERDVEYTAVDGFITRTSNHNYTWNLVSRKEITITDDVTTYIPLSNAGLL